MARALSPRRRMLTTLAAWSVAFLIFFPVLWMILTSFKTEASAVASPPEFLGADWTFENYAEVWARSDYPRFFWNSVVISVGSTLLGLIVAIPALIFWRYFRARVDGYLLGMELASEQFVRHLVRVGGK